MGAPQRSATQVLAWACVAAAVLPAALAGAPQTTAPATGANRMVSEADCTAPSLVATIAPEKIGEPVRRVTVEAAWVAATDTVPAHCRVDGVFAPVDTAPTARVINFRVILPASWTRRGAQIGGGGINGIIPNVAGGESPAVDRRCCSAASPPTAAIRATSCRRSAAAAGRRPRLPIRTGRSTRKRSATSATRR